MNNTRVHILKVLNRIRHYARGFWYENDLGEVVRPSTIQRTHAPPAQVSSRSSQSLGVTPKLDATKSSQVQSSRALSEAQSIPPGPPSFKSKNSTELSRIEQLKMLNAQILQCQKCPLHQTRTHAVPGSGVLDPMVLIIGEAPGANEDKYGKPFVGRSGKYLDKWLDSINMYRTENVYIANIIKCRPPQNRDPAPKEIIECMPYLKAQVELIRPKVILVLGRIAAHHLFNIKDSLATMRNNAYSFDNIPTIVTYHPSAVLRNPNLRQPVWDDLKKLQRLVSEQ